MDITCRNCGRKGIKLMADGSPFATHSYDEAGMVYHHEAQFAKPKSFEVRYVYCKAENGGTGWKVVSEGDKHRLVPS